MTASARPKMGPMIVFIVEDNDTDFMFARKTIEDMRDSKGRPYDIRIRRALDAADAHEILGTGYTPDLALVDRVLPGQPGAEVADELAPTPTDVWYLSGVDSDDPQRAINKNGDHPALMIVAAVLLTMRRLAVACFVGMIATP